MFTAAELMRMQLAEPRWAVPDLVPAGLSILAGRPKVGKSFLTLNLALAVASGGTALGQQKVTAGDVLYLSLEDTRRRLQARLRQMLQGPGAAAPARLTLATSWPRLDEGGLAELTAWLDLHPQARLVVIDTFARVRQPAVVRASAYSEDYAAMAPLKALADQHEREVAILAVMHTRKMPAADPFDTISGTLGLSGAADALLVLQRERGQHDAALHVTGRDLEERELALSWDRECALWSVLGAAAEYRMSRERAAVLEALRAAGRPMRPTELAPLLEKGLSASKMLLLRMERDGLLKNDGGGQYTPAQ
jgi:hypothetical protein